MNDSLLPAPPPANPARTPLLCRDCYSVADDPPPRCPARGGGRRLMGFTIAHADCDAFHASVKQHAAQNFGWGRFDPATIGRDQAWLAA